MAKEWLNMTVSGMPAGFPVFSTYLKAVLSKMLVNLGMAFSGEGHFYCLLVTAKTCNFFLYACVAPLRMNFEVIFWPNVQCVMQNSLSVFGGDQGSQMKVS